MRVIIVGGVAGGMSAATRMRRLDENAEIIVLEQGPYVSFANCGLPYALGGVISERQSLLLQSPASLRERFNLDVRVRHEVLAINRERQVVLVRNLDTEVETEEHYDALVLSPGTEAATLASDNSVPILPLHTVPDLDAILEHLGNASDENALVVGAGFIGLEVTENLIERGTRVTLVQRPQQVLSHLDPEMATPLAQRLREAGVDLRLGTSIEAISGGIVTLSDGSQHKPTLIVNAIGVRPNARLAAECGLKIGTSGGIAVDARQRTLDPAIFAVGDAAEKTDAMSGEPGLYTLAGLANRHGRAAADAIAGRGVDSSPALGTSGIGLFGLVVASTGWSERRLVSDGRPHRVIHTHPASHAGYYPGATTLTMKLLVDAATDEILGAQVIGEDDSAARRIDVIATAIAGRITASALSRLELAYAPQFGSAKDPVNLLGYVAEGRADGSSPAVQWHELDSECDAGAQLIDIRSPEECARGSIPGARNIPLDQLRDRIQEISASRVIVHCQVGQRGHTAMRLLLQSGYDAANLDGGYLTWKAGTGTVQPELVAA